MIKSPFSLIPVGLALALAGCNPGGSSDDGGSISSSDELALAKAFVQDFSGLQESIRSLETPLQTFGEQVDTDVNSVTSSDSEAFGMTVDSVMSQLEQALEPMVQDGAGQGFVVTFADDSGNFTSDDPDLVFSNASWNITSAGVITGSGTATYMGTEEVTFDINMTLPEINTNDTGTIDYDLVANIDFTGDNLGLDVNNGTGNLSLSLGGGTTLEELGNNGPDSDDTINGISLGLDNSVLTAGGLTLSGAMDLDVSTLAFSNNNENVDAAFSVSVEGELTNSAGDAFGASLTLTNGSLDRDYTSTDPGREESMSVGLDYAITTAFTTSAHDFDVTLNGTFGASMDIVDDGTTWSEDGSIMIDGDLLITHNDASFNIDYDFDASMTNSSSTDGSDQIDMVMQDATETEHTVQILMGDYDDAGTTAFEFGVVRVNGTQYGTLADDNGQSVATFTDDSTLVVMDSND